VEKISIRQLEPKDTPDLVSIYKSITQTPEVDEFEKMINELAKIKSHACFVALSQDRVIGYIVSYYLTVSFGIHKSAWIPMVGVSPEFMGHGIGKRLAETVFDYYKSRGIQAVYTSVRWFDADVLSFFRTLGFNRSEFINLQKRLDD
jgi:ribosomal protein S18 acetylase RimI-like enzyme